MRGRGRRAGQPGISQTGADVRRHPVPDLIARAALAQSGHGGVAVLRQRARQQAGAGLAEQAGTAGLGYWFWDADLARYEQVAGLPNVGPGRIDAFQAPLLCDPGTRFTYGINTDWLGRVVEAVTGQGLDVVVKEAITGPLGLDHTRFRVDPASGICASIPFVSSPGRPRSRCKPRPWSAGA